MRRANFVGTKFGGGGKRGRAKIPSPQPLSFLPARAFSLAREARHQFCSKKVRISSNKRTIKIKNFLKQKHPKNCCLYLYQPFKIILLWRPSKKKQFRVFLSFIF